MLTTDFSKFYASIIQVLVNQSYLLKLVLVRSEPQICQKKVRESFKRLQKYFFLVFCHFFQAKNLLLIISHVGWFRYCCCVNAHTHTLCHTHTFSLSLSFFITLSHVQNVCRECVCVLETESEVLECDAHFVNM